MAVARRTMTLQKLAGCDKDETSARRGKGWQYGLGPVGTWYLCPCDRIESCATCFS